MNEPKGSIVPFGKYKGRLIEELLLDDPVYLQWLSGQEWFRAKFAFLNQVIINRGSEPEETPDHNAMQVRFLADEFCLRFALCCCPGLEQRARDELHNHYWPIEAGDASERRARIGDIAFRSSCQFEVRGVDVLFGIEALDLNKNIHSRSLFWRPEYLERGLPVELKPTVGDDYPAVLRQMKLSGSKVLFVGEYTGKGATEEQFVKTFATASI